MNDKNGKNKKRHPKVIPMPGRGTFRLADVFPWAAELAAHQERSDQEPLDEETEAWLAKFPEKFQAAKRRSEWRRKFEEIHPMGRDVEFAFSPSVVFGTGGGGWKAFATVHGNQGELHDFVRFSLNLAEVDSEVGRIMEAGHYGARVVVQVAHDGTKPSRLLAEALLTDPRFGRLFQVHPTPGKPESPDSLGLVSRLLATSVEHLECMAQFVERAGKAYGFKVTKATTHDLAFFRGEECHACLECLCECKCESGPCLEDRLDEAAD